ncbi:23S rRNA (pseudouridine(1915)-N(3))-methyltransferase RlmH [Candidatus Saccharibacteria bacterium TM7i]|nr:23S rRNA (pseudouridine(1915)-N(3))-methyltransferase RlmH [Candidatus Saccharibacteria bacterium TM7i]
MSVVVLAVGKKHEDWIQVGVQRYETRLRQPFDIKWEMIPHSSYEADRARQEESDRLLGRIADDAFVVLLDERGRNIESPTLSAMLEQQFSFGKKVVLIIGGAYGVDERVHARADFVWSLSKLVFPHQLVRLIVAEQIYRAQQISRGSGYHHE